MMNLKIDGNEYQFNFNISFMKAMNKRHKETVKSLWGDNPRANMGLFYAISAIFVDDDIEELVEFLLEANKSLDPKVTRDMLQHYIDEELEDIDTLLDEVKNCLSRSNSCKKEMKRVEELLEEMKKEEKKNE